MYHNPVNECICSMRKSRGIKNHTKLKGQAMSGVLKVKDHVNWKGMQPEILLALMITHSIWQKMYPDLDCVITSITDGKHKENSLHFSGQAFDLRTKNIPNIFGKKTFIALVIESLHEQCDVIFEGEGQDWEHLHIEFDPK